MNRKLSSSPLPKLVASAAVLLAAAPLNAQQATTVVSGEVRVRTEAARPVAAEAWENFTLLRTRIGLLATLNPSVRAFVQLQDARAFGEEASTVAGSAGQIDLHQGYLELSTTLGEQSLALRAGRQEIALGNERLVGAVGWSNTGRAFDAARLTLGAKDRTWNAGAFLATVHESHARFRHPGVAHLEQDHWFTGVFAGGKTVEAYALYDSDAHFGAFTGVDRATLGGRLQAPAASRVIASLEGAYQLGSQKAGIGESVVDQDIKAYFAGARAGMKTGVDVLPSLGVGLDVLSGDDQPAGAEYTAFNTLYATNHRYYGYMDLFLDGSGTTRQHRGLVDAMLNAKAGLGRAGTLEVDLHRFSLANSAGLDRSELGWELDLTYPFRIAEAGRFVFGYSVFRNGAAAPAVGLGADGKIRHWGFVQAAVPF